jgi:hypothetical protein
MKQSSPEHQPWKWRLFRLDFHDVERCMVADGNEFEHQLAFRVIWCEARNLALKKQALPDSSSPAAPRNDRLDAFFRILIGCGPACVLAQITLSHGSFARCRRVNALKSTGPQTERGKARVALNAPKHGRRAAALQERLARAGYGESEALYWRIWDSKTHETHKDRDKQLRTR